MIIYRSAIGVERTYAGWSKEADKFYDDIYDAEFTVLKPNDWFERWTKVLGLVKVEEIL